MAIYGSRDRMVRHYVEVDWHHFKDCSVLPTMVYWSDGRRWEATVLGHPLRERCKTHGYAIKYDILVSRQRRVLWRDEQGWFFRYLRAFTGRSRSACLRHSMLDR